MSDQQEPPEDHGFSLEGRVKKLVGGSQYLDVDDRMQWLIADIEKGKFGEDASYEVFTECLGIEEATGAMFRATITVENGDHVFRRATGHGSETRSDFLDFYEKAETKAVGRALNRLGYGTEGALVELGLFVDSPRGSGPMHGSKQSHRRPEKDIQNPELPDHIDQLYQVAQRAKIGYNALDKRVREIYQVAPERLTVDQAEEVIAAIQSKQVTGG